MIELSHKPLIRAYRDDCMGLMTDTPDEYYDLAIVDPEFGIDIANSNRLVLDKGLKGKEWDKEPVDKPYFDELFRITRNQIIWGGNYFKLDPCKGFLIWDKFQPEQFSFGMCDYAGTSFDKTAKIFRYSVRRMKDRIHPTQKPVSLYRWLLTNYAKPGQRILDTHGGSFSSAIACWQEGYDLDICEIDEEYFEAACERFERETRQQKLFSTPGEQA